MRSRFSDINIVSSGAEASAGSDCLWFFANRFQKEKVMSDINTLRNGLVVTAFWDAKPEEVGSLVDIIHRFLPQAQNEPGVLAFQIHQSLTEPTKFFFYEVFKDEEAFAVHQQSEHFKTLIVRGK